MKSVDEVNSLKEMFGLCKEGAEQHHFIPGLRGGLRRGEGGGGGGVEGGLKRGGGDEGLKGRRGGLRPLNPTKGS